MVDFFVKSFVCDGGIMIALGHAGIVQTGRHPLKNMQADHLGARKAGRRLLEPVVKLDHAITIESDHTEMQLIKPGITQLFEVFDHRCIVEENSSHAFFRVVNDALETYASISCKDENVFQNQLIDLNY